MHDKQAVKLCSQDRENQKGAKTSQESLTPHTSGRPSQPPFPPLSPSAIAVKKMHMSPQESSVEKLISKVTASGGVAFERMQSPYVGLVPS